MVQHLLNSTFSMYYSVFLSTVTLFSTLKIKMQLHNKINRAPNERFLRKPFLIAELKVCFVRNRRNQSKPVFRYFWIFYLSVAAQTNYKTNNYSPKIPTFTAKPLRSNVRWIKEVILSCKPEIILFSLSNSKCEFRRPSQ